MSAENHGSVAEMVDEITRFPEWPHERTAPSGIEGITAHWYGRRTDSRGSFAEVWAEPSTWHERQLERTELLWGEDDPEAIRAAIHRAVVGAAYVQSAVYARRLTDRAALVSSIAVLQWEDARQVGAGREKRPLIRSAARVGVDASLILEVLEVVTRHVFQQLPHLFGSQNDRYLASVLERAAQDYAAGAAAGTYVDVDYSAPPEWVAEVAGFCPPVRDLVAAAEEAASHSAEALRAAEDAGYTRAALEQLTWYARCA